MTLALPAASTEQACRAVSFNTLSVAALLSMKKIDFKSFLGVRLDVKTSSNIFASVSFCFASKYWRRIFFKFCEKSSIGVGCEKRKIMNTQTTTNISKFRMRNATGWLFFILRRFESIEGRKRLKLSKFSRAVHCRRAVERPQTWQKSHQNWKKSFSLAMKAWTPNFLYWNDNRQSRVVT